MANTGEASPTDDEYREVIHELNPWHQTGQVPSGFAPDTERSLAEMLWRRLVRSEPRRHQVILGPRRAGKTTVLYQTVRRLLAHGVPQRDVVWLRMDHPVLMDIDLGTLVRHLLDARSAAEDGPLYLMIDEIVYTENWDLWLKAFYDEQWHVRISATSSGTAIIRDRRSESGTGRWQEHFLMPIQLDEWMEFAERAAAFDTLDTLGQTLHALETGQGDDQSEGAWRLYLMLVGGFPELLFKGLDVMSRDADLGTSSLQHHVIQSQRILKDDAVDRTIYKDIPQYTNIESPLQLEKLLYALAGQVTGLISPQRLTQQLGITQPTIDKYLSYLERSYLVFMLTNYSGSEINVQRRGRKVFFVDGAVRNATLQRGLRPIHDAGEHGYLLENLAAASLNTLATHEATRAQHWRDGRLEVDLIYQDPDRSLAFEIGSSPSHSRRGLHALIAQHEQFRGNCYLVAPGCVVRHPDDTGIGTLPYDVFLRVVGSQSKHAMSRRLGV